MNFASDVFFRRLKYEVSNADNDGRIYYEMDQLLWKAVAGLLYKKLPSNAVGEVYQDVLVTVWRNLSKYIVLMDDKSEDQRMAWIITVTRRRIADYYAKKAMTDSSLVPIDEVVHYSEVGVEEAVNKKMFTSKMNKVLVELFELNTSPEKIMGYVYSKIILSTGGKSGKPSITAEQLHNKSLYEIYENMKRDLSLVLEVEIPETCYISLKNKLDLKDACGRVIGDSLFELSIKKITDGTNRIQAKIEFLQKESENGKTY